MALRSLQALSKVHDDALAAQKPYLSHFEANELGMVQGEQVVHMQPLLESTPTRDAAGSRDSVRQPVARRSWFVGATALLPAETVAALLLLMHGQSQQRLFVRVLLRQRISQPAVHRLYHSFGLGEWQQAMLCRARAAKQACLAGCQLIYTLHQQVSPMQRMAARQACQAVGPCKAAHVCTTQG